MPAPLAVLCRIPRAGARQRKCLPAPPSWLHGCGSEQLVCRDAEPSGEQARRVLGDSQGCNKEGVGEILALSLAEWIPAGRAVRGRRREGRGRAGRPEEGPPLSFSRDRGARWVQLGLFPPAAVQPSPGSGFSQRAGSCTGASLPSRASSRRADEDRERELGAADIRLAGTRLGKSCPGTIGRASVGGSGAPAPAETRPSPWPPWWFSWAGTFPRFWLSSRRRVSEREGGSSALSLHNPCPPGPPSARHRVLAHPQWAGVGGCHPRGRAGKVTPTLASSAGKLTE